jgi:DNA-binding phage protein
MTDKHIDYFADELKEELKDKDYAIKYLTTAWDSGDTETIMIAVKDIVEAHTQGKKK